MRTLTIAILVASAAAQLSAQPPHATLARIRLALERPGSTISGADSGEALRTMERQMLGVPIFEPLAGAPNLGPFEFVAPQLRGEFIRMALPVGEYFSHGMRTLAAANHRRQEQVARRRAEAELSALQESAPQPVLSDVARQYLESVITLAQTNSINRAQIDWPTVRREVFSRAAGAQVASDTHAAVRWLVAALRDRHSAFLDPIALKSLPARSAAASGKLEGRIVDDRFGFVLIPTFGSPDQASIDQFATDLQGVINSLEASKPCGWVVDLRSNGGGNMWPMLAGIGPLLGAGHLGSFKDPDGRGASWSYENGEAKSDGRTLARSLKAAVTLHVETPPVAVLVGPTTASSGEAIAIAFRGRSSTRLFGAMTRGLTTSNRVFPLSDGSLLNLTTAAFADRAGTPYQDGVPPDEPWSDPTGIEKGSLPLNWLAAQPSCANPV